MADRETARLSGIGEVLEEEDRPEDQYQCNICKTFCYLSQVICQCSKKVVCVDHRDLLCDNRTPHHIQLRKRFTDEDLMETYSRLAERAAIPSVWQSKLTKLLSESARHPSALFARSLQKATALISLCLKSTVSVNASQEQTNGSTPQILSLSASKVGSAHDDPRAALQ